MLQVGLKDNAEYDLKGNKIEDPVFPFRVAFVPKVATPDWIPNCAVMDYAYEFAEGIVKSLTKADEHLFDVYAFKDCESLKE